MEQHVQYKPVFYQHRKPSFRIDKFTIIGERHSGTNWLEKLLLSRLSIPITWEYCWKHFPNESSPNKLASAQNTLFLGITRNIYQWIGGFFKLPHHVDKSIAYDIEKFLLSEWKSEVNDVDYLTGKPYKNIFELRRCKLEFLDLCLPLIVDSMLITRYEDLLIDPETLVSFISKEFDILKTNAVYDKLIISKPQHPYILPQTALEIIDRNTDWDMENKFGYYKSEYK